MGISRSSHVPLYKQLYHILRSQIELGELKTGDAIPTEKELTRQYAVSRVTTRKALQMLVDEGLIVRQPGKGSYVHTTRIEEDQSSLQGFAELMVARHPEQVMEVQRFEIIPAAEEVARELELAEGDRVLRIQRRHMIEAQPVAYAVIYLPFALGKLLTPEEVSTTPVYTLLTRKAGVIIKSATQRIRAIAADHWITDVLGIPIGAPVLMVRRVTYSVQEQPLEYIRLYYPGDRHELVMNLHRTPASDSR